MDHGTKKLGHQEVIDDSDHDKTTEVMNSQRLKLSTKDLHKIKLVNNLV